ncbi:hypothetical protein EYC84_002072 [Monilinia fructicola]|uniref:Uncharacterized protein n=1 Tax=Monilinia fructicola TaxID=38448 RepID=A0A5M9JVL5_MONFR|nr:hypothetical protein EYC84_002072 [Monilinia fructicola]
MSTCISSPSQNGINLILCDNDPSSIKNAFYWQKNAIQRYSCLSYHCRVSLYSPEIYVSSDSSAYDLASKLKIDKGRWIADSDSGV